MRAVLLVLLVACGKDDGSGPDGETDGPADTVVAPCATFDDYACADGGSACFAECLDALRISCEGRECFLQGVGQGSGTSCTISAGDRQYGCGLCETAWRECR